LIVQGWQHRARGSVCAPAFIGKGREMANEVKDSAAGYRMVAATLMVVLLTFGVLQLLNVIRV
jgi:hypothetical protein